MLLLGVLCPTAAQVLFTMVSLVLCCAAAEVLLIILLLGVLCCTVAKVLFTVLLLGVLCCTVAKSVTFTLLKAQQHCRQPYIIAVNLSCCTRVDSAVTLWHDWRYLSFGSVA